MKHSPVHVFTKSLFQHGLEVYDSIAKQGTNLGGAQLFQLRGWKNKDSQVIFNNKVFGDVLKELAATLYTVNRINLDKEGNPVKLPNGRNQRTNNGLMLYMQYGEEGITARQAVTRIIEVCPELSGNVAAVVDLIHEIPELDILTQVKTAFSGGGELVDMNPYKCVMLAVNSGSANSSQYWSFINGKTAAGRASVDESTKVPEGLEGII